MSYFTLAGKGPSQQSKRIGEQLAYVPPAVTIPSQATLDINAALEKLYSLGGDRKAIEQFISNSLVALKQAKGKGKKIKGSNKMVLGYMRSDTNMATVTKMLKLVREFDISQIATALKTGTEIEKTKASDAVSFWREMGLNTLSLDVVCDQIRQYFSTQFRPTDVQRHLYRIMNSGTTPCADLLTAPTGSGKTSGLAACLTEMSSRGDKLNLTIVSTRSDKAMEEFIGVMCSASVPICIARRNPKNGSIEIIPVWETMGKVPLQSNNASKREKSKTIIEMSQRMRAALTDTPQNQRTRRWAFRTFKTEYPLIVLCEASFRENGLTTIVEQAKDYVEYYSGKYSTYTVIIDDFCASATDVDTGHSIARVMETCERVVLMTATPPAEIGSESRPVNIKRARNNLEPFKEFEYKSTLGPGLELATLDADGNEVPYSILNHDLSVFEHSSFALQAMSFSTTIAMLRALLTPASVLPTTATPVQIAQDMVERKAIGDKATRDYMLSLLPNISLD